MKREIYIKGHMKAGTACPAKATGPKASWQRAECALTAEGPFRRHLKRLIFSSSQSMQSP